MAGTSLKHHLLFGLTLSVLTFFLVGLVAEVALRLLGYSPMERPGMGRVLIPRLSDNPILRYELTPNAQGFSWYTDVKINSHGFRDHEYAVDRREALRIVALGDSVTFGNKLPAEDRFTEQIEESLNRELSRPVEVLNLGVTGYDNIQEVALLEELGLRFSPDLVVLQYSLNDVIDTALDLETIERYRAKQSPIYHLRTAQAIRVALDKLSQAWALAAGNEDEATEHYAELVDDDAHLSHLIKTLEARIHRGANEERAAKLRVGSVLSWLGLRRRAGGPAFLLLQYTSKARIGKIAHAFRLLARLREQHGFDAVLVISPYLREMEGLDIAYQIIEHEASQYGFPVLQLHQEFAAAGVEKLRIDPEDWQHPNREGHGLIARKLHEYVLANVH